MRCQTRPTIAAVAGGPTPEARAAATVDYVQQVWARWAAQHEPTIARWYEAYVLPDRL